MLIVEIRVQKYTQTYVFNYITQKLQGYSKKGK